MGLKMIAACGATGSLATPLITFPSLCMQSEKVTMREGVSIATPGQRGDGVTLSFCGTSPMPPYLEGTKVPGLHCFTLLTFSLSMESDGKVITMCVTYNETLFSRRGKERGGQHYFLFWKQNANIDWTLVHWR